MNKGRLFLLAAVAILLSAVVATNCAMGRVQSIAPNDLYGQIELFSSVVTIIRSDYVDEVSARDLVYGALRGLLSSLDAHSQFMDPETYKEIKIDTKGEFGGIGIEITIKDGLLTIITPIDYTPGAKAGIRPGDIIVRIENESTKGITLLEAVKKLRGKTGTDVTITILREKEGRVFDVTVTRGIIQVESIKEAYLLEGNIGYVRLSEFQERTPGDLEKALVKLEKEGMDSLILDLRNNPGGLLDVSARVSDKFLEEGRLIVTTRGRGQTKETAFKARKKYTHPSYPMVVLVNGGSASASEIVAGAIQDNRRGIILGTKTFGKGSVQTVIPLKDGSAVRLTTAKYFTPSGRAIREEGIVPDVMVELKEPPVKPKAKEDKVFEKLDKEKNNKVYDNQIVSALNLLKGIKAYDKMLAEN